MEFEPKVGDLATVALGVVHHGGPGPGLVVRIDASGWYYLTFPGDWETFFRRDQIQVISRG